jgi:hypothetical protein
MLPKNEGPVTVRSVSPPGILFALAAVFLLKGLRGSVAGLVVAAVASSPW